MSEDGEKVEKGKGEKVCEETGRLGG